MGPGCMRGLRANPSRTDRMRPQQSEGLSESAWHPDEPPQPLLMLHVAWTRYDLLLTCGACRMRGRPGPGRGRRRLLLLLVWLRLVLLLVRLRGRRRRVQRRRAHGLLLQLLRVVSAGEGRVWQRRRQRPGCLRGRGARSCGRRQPLRDDSGRRLGRGWGAAALELGRRRFCIHRHLRLMVRVSTPWGTRECASASGG
jgi:hypothetical protein